MASREEVREVKRRHSARLLNQPGICGVGVEKDEAGQYILTLHIDANALEAGKQLPDQIEGCPVKVVQSGPFRKLPAANQSECR